MFGIYFYTGCFACFLCNPSLGCVFFSWKPTVEDFYPQWKELELISPTIIRHLVLEVKNRETLLFGGRFAAEDLVPM